MRVPFTTKIPDSAFQTLLIGGEAYLPAARMARTEKLKCGGLAAELRMLLETGDGADLLLQTGDFCLPVHRAVLCARSPVFAAMFRHDTKEAREACIDIADVKETVLRKLLHFVYTDEVPQLDAWAADLLAAADKYQLASLKETCEEWLVNNLSVEDAAGIAILAITHSCKKLKKSVVCYMEKHYLEIIGTKGWERALRSNVTATVEICKLISAKAKSRKNKKLAAPVRKQVQEKRTLARDLGELLASGRDADVTLAVSGSRLRAHRALLAARSPVFAAMLESDSSETLDIRDDTPEVLRQVLHFVYTDEVPHLSSMAAELYAAAVKYDLPKLGALCEEQLSTGLTIENVSARAALALTHDCRSFRKIVMKFVKDNFMRVIGTAGWARLLWEKPAAAIAICQFAADPSVESRTESDKERATSLKLTLHDAAWRGDTDKVRRLLAAGAELDARDALWKRTALHWASAAGRSEAVRCLLRRGAAVGAKDCAERTPLHLAACHGDDATVRLLLAAGAKPNSQDDAKATPLHCAAKHDRAAAARALLWAGAATNVRDASRCTAFLVANECDSRRVLSVL